MPGAGANSCRRSMGGTDDGSGHDASGHGNSGSHEDQIDWGNFHNDQEGNHWVQTLELSPEAHNNLVAGQWTLVVDGHTVDPNHLPSGDLHDATVQITNHQGAEIESFQGVDKIEWGNTSGNC